MKRKMFYKKDYVKELLKIIRTETDTTKLPKLLSDYHEKDIAEAITLLSENERKQLYPVLGAQKVAEIFSYLDDSEKYIEELPIEKAAKVVSYMDADDALDILDDLTEHKKQELVSHLDEDAQKDVRKLLSYDELFHNQIMEFTDNQLMIRISQNITECFRSYRSKAFAVDKIMGNAVTPHAKIIDAFHKRDTQLGYNLMIEHLEISLEDILKYSTP